MLVDAPYQGRPRKLLMQANRSGFFYVLDRTNGELLLGRPFVKRLNWASGIGSDGRPILTESNEPQMWHFETGQGWKASPITYMVNGRQYVAIAGVNTIFAFALPAAQ